MLPSIIERLKLRYVSKEERLSNSSWSRNSWKGGQRATDKMFVCSEMVPENILDFQDRSAQVEQKMDLVLHFYDSAVSLGLISFPSPHPGLCFRPAGRSTNPWTIQATSCSEAFNLHFLHGNAFCCAKATALTLKGRGDSLFWSVREWPGPRNIELVSLKFHVTT